VGAALRARGEAQRKEPRERQAIRRQQRLPASAADAAAAVAQRGDVVADVGAHRSGGAELHGDDAEEEDGGRGQRRQRQAQLRRQAAQRRGGALLVARLQHDVQRALQAQLRAGAGGAGAGARGGARRCVCRVVLARQQQRLGSIQRRGARRRRAAVAAAAAARSGVAHGTCAAKRVWHPLGLARARRWLRVAWSAPCSRDS